MFRECFTSAENVETLNDIMYEANTQKRDIDMEEVRLVLNDDYSILKADAEKEILFRCRMSAGSAVWNAKKNYVPPPGMTVWQVGVLNGKTFQAGNEPAKSDPCWLSLPETVDNDVVIAEKIHESAGSEASMSDKSHLAATQAVEEEIHLDPYNLAPSKTSPKKARNTQKSQLEDGSTDDSDHDEESQSSSQQRLSLLSLNPQSLSNEEKKTYDEAAIKLQSKVRGLGGKRKAVLKTQMKEAAKVIGDSMEVQMAAARLQAQFRARKSRLYVEQLKKEKRLQQQGIEKKMTLVLHTVAHVKPHAFHNISDSSNLRISYPYEHLYVTAYHHPRPIVIELDMKDLNADPLDTPYDAIPESISEAELAKEKKKQELLAKALAEDEEKNGWEEVWEDREVEESRVVTRRVDPTAALAAAAAQSGVDNKASLIAMSAFNTTTTNTGNTEASELYETVTITEIIKIPHKIKRKKVPKPLFISRCISRNLIRGLPNEQMKSASKPSDTEDTYYWEDTFEIDLGFGKKLSDYVHLRIEVWRAAAPPIYVSNSATIYKYIPRVDLVLFRREVKKKTTSFSFESEVEGTPDYCKRMDIAQQMILGKYLGGLLFPYMNAKKEIELESSFERQERLKREREKTSGTHSLQSSQIAATKGMQKRDNVTAAVLPSQIDANEVHSDDDSDIRDDGTDASSTVASRSETPVPLTAALQPQSKSQKPNSGSISSASISSNSASNPRSIYTNELSGTSTPDKPKKRKEKTPSDEFLGCLILQPAVYMRKCVHVTYPLSEVPPRMVFFGPNDATGSVIASATAASKPVAPAGTNAVSLPTITLSHTVETVMQWMKDNKAKEETRRLAQAAEDDLADAAEETAVAMHIQKFEKIDIDKFPHTGSILQGRILGGLMANEDNMDGVDGAFVKYDYSNISIVKLLKYIYIRVTGDDKPKGIQNYLRRDEIPLCLLLQQKPVITLNLKHVLNAGFIHANFAEETINALDTSHQSKQKTQDSSSNNTRNVKASSIYGNPYVLLYRKLDAFQLEHATATAAAGQQGNDNNTTTNADNATEASRRAHLPLFQSRWATTNTTIGRASRTTSFIKKESPTPTKRKSFFKNTSKVTEVKQDETIGKDTGQHSSLGAYAGPPLGSVPEGRIDWNEEFEFDLSYITRTALMAMVDYYVKNEFLKTCGATANPKAAEAAHNAEVKYQQCMQLKNFPTFQMELWSGQVKHPNPINDVKSETSDSSSRPTSRSSRPNSRKENHRTGTILSANLVAAQVAALAPVPGSKEWASALTQHQLSQLSQKQLRLLSMGTLIQEDNTIVPYLLPDGQPNRGQFLGYAELPPTIYLQHCLPPKKHGPKNPGNFIDSQAVLKAKQQQIEPPSECIPEAARTEGSTREALAPALATPLTAASTAGQIDVDKAIAKHITLDCEADTCPFYKFEIQVHGALELPASDPRRRQVKDHVPSPYAIVFWNNRELGRTASRSQTNCPSWPVYNPELPCDSTTNPASLTFYVPNLKLQTHANLRNELRIELWDAAAAPPDAPTLPLPPPKPKRLSTSASITTQASTATSTPTLTQPQSIMADPTIAPISTGPESGQAENIHSQVKATATNTQGDQQSATLTNSDSGTTTTADSVPIENQAPPRKLDPVYSSHFNDANGGFLGCLSLKKDALVRFLHAGVGVPRTAVNYVRKNDGTTNIEPYSALEIEKGTLNIHGKYGLEHGTYSVMCPLTPDPGLTAEEIEEKCLIVQGLLEVSLIRHRFNGLDVMHNSADIRLSSPGNGSSEKKDNSKGSHMLQRSDSLDSLNSLGSNHAKTGGNQETLVRSTEPGIASQYMSSVAIPGDTSPVFINPAILTKQHYLLLMPAHGTAPTAAFNAHATGGILQVITHIQDKFLSEAEPMAAMTYLHTLALAYQELVMETITKDHNYRPPPRPKCGLQTCEGCYNVYENENIPCIVKANTVSFPRLLAQRSQEPNETYPFNFGIRLRKTPINSSVSDAFNIKYTSERVQNTNHINLFTQEKSRDLQVNTHCWFHCLANDKCRRNLKSCGLVEYDCRDFLPTVPANHLKGTIAGVPIIPYKPTFSEIIQEHLEQHHWNMLVQFNFMDDQIYAERQANMKRKEEEAMQVVKVGSGAGGAVIVQGVDGTVHGNNTIGNELHTRNNKSAKQSVQPSALSSSLESDLKNAGELTRKRPEGSSSPLLSRSKTTPNVSITGKSGIVPAAVVAGTYVIPSTTGPSVTEGPFTKKNGMTQLGVAKKETVAGSGARAAKAISK